VIRALLFLAVLAACHDTSSKDEPCRCTPGNVSRTKGLRDDAPLTGEALVGLLRRHQTYVTEGRNPREIKMLDDELRFAIASFCQPCGEWVEDRMTLGEMFPLARLDDAVRVVCMGLVLRDGTTAYGEARPRACR
jgi:hypothetical protein